MTPFFKKFLIILAGAFVAVVATQLPEASEYKAELLGLAALLIGWGVPAPGDRKGPQDRAPTPPDKHFRIKLSDVKKPPPWLLLPLGLAVALTSSSCGAAAPIARTCVSGQLGELSKDILGLILTDGGPNAPDASAELLATARMLAKRHGVAMVRCAIQNALSELWAEHGALEGVGRQAALSRGEDMLGELEGL